MPPQSSDDQVHHLTHADRRVNIPPAELDDFVDDEDREPVDVFYERYAPRDVDDPVLVWQEKEAEDRRGLTVKARPIFIQEKIHPRVLIDDLQRHGKQAPGKGEEVEIPNLFSDFNGIEFEDLVDFYEHDQRWSNRLILGDALTVMTSLAEKERLRGKVQMVYVDPPYGIKFGSNWQVSAGSRDVKDGKEADLTRQPEQIKAFRDTWRLGVSSYLSYLRDRVVVARDLLTDSGSVFVQIGDENVHLVRNLLDEIFGADNFVSLITLTKAGSATTDVLGAVNEYLLWYGRDRRQLKHRRLMVNKPLGGLGASKYDQLELPDGTRRPMSTSERRSSIVPDGARPYRHDNMTSQSVGRDKGEGAASWFEVELEGKTYDPGGNRWKTNREGMDRLLAAERLYGARTSLAYIRYLDDFPAVALTNAWADIGGIQSRADPKVYVVQTPTSAVQRCMLMTTDPGDLVLDPTCGSGTTAYVAEQWGRRWITIDTSRVALALARARLMGAKYPYYLLADSPEGVAKEKQTFGRASAEAPHRSDVRKGFVYKRVPHITLKSIAQNPDIREGMTRDEIDAAIVRHGESETLYDQPYEDKKRIRVTGPFTVESLSSHRSLDDRATVPASQASAEVDPAQPDFATLILDNLRTAGVQNTVRDERLEFDTLEPMVGEWLAASGTYNDADGTSIRVAVSLGPETGTVGPRQVKEAAKEAMRGFGCDVLLVCGFAFDAAAGERAKQVEAMAAASAEAAESDIVTLAAESTLGSLTVLLAKINPDLLLGDRLANTGQGNLFLVFGEPDVQIERDGDELTVEVRGVDVFDPTTGAVRSRDTDSIASWFVDTAYNGESFFVRHAYFAGNGKGKAAGVDPYDRLRRALKADIDKEAWATVFTTRSRPFPVPDTGRIAVKVINDFGDEVLQVYDVPRA